MNHKSNNRFRLSVAISSGGILLLVTIALVLAHDPPDISRSFYLWSGITGTGTTLTYHDPPPYNGHYGRGKTQSSAPVYYQFYHIRA